LPTRPRLLLLACCLLLASALSLALTQARLGSRLFFLFATGLCISQLLAVIAIRRAEPPRTWLWIAIGVAVACRVPLMVGPVNYDSDMVRYLYDGRVQRLGYNPYAVVPSDPALAHTHTADTARMPSRNARTPYPPAAQLFFRLMVTLRESARVMKSVLALLDIATIFIVLQWLRVTGRSEWLFLGYAWNPLVILEIAHSGHIDGLGVFWIALCAYWMARRRTSLAAVAFTLAVATKLLPIVLAPLFLGRVKPRDVAIGAGALLLLYLPFMTASARLDRDADRSGGVRPRCGCRGGRVGALEARRQRSRGVGLANGRHSRLRARHISLVPPLLHPFPCYSGHAAVVGVDLDRSPRLPGLGMGAVRGTLASSRLAHDGRVRCGRGRARVPGYDPPFRSLHRRSSSGHPGSALIARSSQLSLD
jgi:hypothetical protein